MSLTTVTFAGVELTAAVPSAFVATIDRGFLGTIRDTVQPIPGRAGAWLFPEEPGPRELVVIFTVGDATPAERRTELEALADWVDHPTAEPLIFGDEPDRYWLARLSGMSSPEETVLTGVVELTFIADPYAYALEVSTLAQASGDPDTLELTDNTPSTFEAPDTVAAPCIVEVTADEALAGGFELTLNNETLAYGTAVGLGDTVTVSSVAHVVTLGANVDLDLDGTFDPDDLSMADVDGTFPGIVPGTNTIEVDGGDVTVAVSWRRRYRA